MVTPRGSRRPIVRANPPDKRQISDVRQTRAMDPVRLAADVRLLRHRKNWTQQRLGEAAGVSRWVVSEIECGHADRQSAHVLARVVAALGAYLSIRLLFRGETLDRLRDRRHARIVDLVVARLIAAGWVVATEVSFSVYGERGSIDVLAFHPATGALLVIEVKTVVPDVGGMLATLDRKVRLAPDLARARGWAVITVSRLLVLPDASTSRRRIAAHEATFEASFPSRNVAVNCWLASPRKSIAGLLFLSDAAPASGRHVPTAPPPPGGRRARTG